MNRGFLHPLGLALEVEIEVDEDGTERLGGVWDYRKDPEGIHLSEVAETNVKKLDDRVKRNQLKGDGDDR